MPTLVVHLASGVFFSCYHPLSNYMNFNDTDGIYTYSFEAEKRVRGSRYPPQLSHSPRSPNHHVNCLLVTTVPLPTAIMFSFISCRNVFVLSDCMMSSSRSSVLNLWGIPHLWGMASCQVGNFVHLFPPSSVSLLCNRCVIELQLLSFSTCIYSYGYFI